MISLAEASAELPTPEELKPLLVSQAEYDAEVEELAKKEDRLAELEDVWNLFVEAHPDRLLVSLAEFRSERGRLGGLRTRLRAQWSAWSTAMRGRREVLRRYRAERIYLRPPVERMVLIAEADRWLAEIRRIRTEIKTTDITIREETERFHRKTVIPPEMMGVLAEIARLTTEIEEEKERLGRKEVVAYQTYEFSKYYKYERGPPYRHRHFEIRADFTIVPGLDEADLNEVKAVVEWKFDDVMSRLGVDIENFEKGDVEMGAEPLETADKFKEETVATVYDKIRGYTWTSPEFDTTIHILEEEMPWFKKEEEKGA